LGVRRKMKAKKIGESVLIIIKTKIFGKKTKLKLELTRDDIVKLIGIQTITKGHEYETPEWVKAIELTTPGRMHEIQAEWVKAVELTTPGKLGEEWAEWETLHEAEEYEYANINELYNPETWRW